MQSEHAHGEPVVRILETYSCSNLMNAVLVQGSESHIPIAEMDQSKKKKKVVFFCAQYFFHFFFSSAILFPRNTQKHMHRERPAETT